MHWPAWRIRIVGFKLGFDSGDQGFVNIVVKRFPDFSQGGQYKLPGEFGALLMLCSSDEQQKMPEVVGEIGSLWNPVVPQSLALAHQKLAALVVFTKKMPSDLECAGRIELEGLHV